LVYQGRFKPFPVQTGEHFLTMAHYEKRNAMRAKLVGRAEDWQWSSGWRRTQGDPKLTAWISAWQVERPWDWVAHVNRPQTASELEGRPFGEESWVRRMAKRFGMEPTLRPHERPRGS
jgi:putative transposase